MQQFTPSGQPLDPDNLGRALAAFTPEGAIVVNEAITTGLVWSAVHASNAAPHTMLGFTGGGIGQGLPTALGAALACPDRRVIAFQADGSGLYTIQALWSMARESADVTVVVCANRSYRILQAELARAGIGRARTQGAGAHRSHAADHRLGCAGEGVRRAGLERAHRRRAGRSAHARACRARSRPDRGGARLTDCRRDFPISASTQPRQNLTFRPKGSNVECS